VQEIAAALDALRTGDFQSRWDAAKQLEASGEAILSPLLTLLQESNADVEIQWFGAKILGSLGHPDAICALGQLLEQSDDEDVRSIAAQGLAELGPDAIDCLASYLKDPQRQMVVLRALTKIHRPEVVPLLLELAQAESAEARSLVFEALDQFIDPRIMKALLIGLTDRSPDVRKTAIASLAVRTQEYPPEDLVGHLIHCLEDTELSVVAQAAKALGRLGTDRGAIALIQKSGEPNLDPLLQKTFIQSLGWINSAVAQEGLIEIWEKLALKIPLPESLLQEILNSVISCAGSAEWVLGLVRLPLLQQSPTLRARAMLTLGRIGSTALLPVLTERLEDPDYMVRLHVVAALKQVDPNLAHAAIEQRLRDEDVSPQLAQGLVIALREW
jgi:HEAT repeat protein